LANTGYWECGGISSSTKQQSQVYRDIKINLRSDNADEDHVDANRVVDGGNVEESECVD